MNTARAGGLHASAGASSYEDVAGKAAKGTVRLEYLPVNLEGSMKGIQRPPHKVTGKGKPNSESILEYALH